MPKLVAPSNKLLNLFVCQRRVIPQREKLGAKLIELRQQPALIAEPRLTVALVRSFVETGNNRVDLLAELLGLRRQRQRVVDGQSGIGRFLRNLIKCLPYEELSTLASNRAILKDFDDFDYVNELILDTDAQDGHVVAVFWRTALGDDWVRLALNPEFLRVFCEGALEVWAEVEPHLV